MIWGSTEMVSREVRFMYLRVDGGNVGFGSRSTESVPVVVAISLACLASGGTGGAWRWKKVKGILWRRKW